MPRKLTTVAYLVTGVVFLLVGLVRLSEGAPSQLRDAGLAISGFVLTGLSLARLREESRPRSI